LAKNDTDLVSTADIRVQTQLSQYATRAAR
jgi:hypothetical protein